MLNQIVIMGRLTRDPELRRTGSGVAVANFTVAVEEDHKSGDDKVTNYIDCTAWRQTGEFVSRYFSKGRMIVVVGSLKDKPWTDKHGSKHNDKFINVLNVYFGDSKRDSDSSNNNNGYSDNGNSYGGYEDPWRLSADTAACSRITIIPILISLLHRIMRCRKRTMNNCRFKCL